MKFLGADWTSNVNMILIQCNPACAIFRHRADRWNVRCPSCGNIDNLRRMREGELRKALTPTSKDR